MNIVNKLTTRHIQQNKGRTVVTTLGICVSVAMITAVFVAMASFLNLFGEIGLISSGKWDAEFDYLNQTQINQIKNDDRNIRQTVEIERWQKRTHRVFIRHTFCDRCVDSQHSYTGGQQQLDAGGQVENPGAVGNRVKTDPHYNPHKCQLDEKRKPGADIRPCADTDDLRKHNSQRRHPQREINPVIPRGTGTHSASVRFGDPVIQPAFSVVRRPQLR